MTVTVTVPLPTVTDPALHARLVGARAQLAAEAP